MKKLLSILSALVLPSLLFSQEIEMADQMRSNGKIYVVVTVMAAIMIGLLIYLVIIDKKLSRLENKQKNK